MNEIKPFSCFALHVKNETSLDEAWESLQEAGLTPLYMEEDFKAFPRIYILAENESTVKSLLNLFPFIQFAEPSELGEIDWQSQWEAHGLNFYDGCVHIDLPHACSSYGKQLKLRPGAGFGDLSHPTTRLIVDMLNDNVGGKEVVDIGCGSGVLALCSVALGAKHVYALDIDPEALKHCQENALLNKMQDKVTISLPQDFILSSLSAPPVILMNMIMTEQQNAWEALKCLHGRHDICLVSGILAEQKQDYIHLAQAWGWKVLKEQEQQGWVSLQLEIRQP
ncbi:50S ribosomal protein L11 methyltransferase [Neochlamydia sp. AcF95]|uniref:50S ribosomal protein L11 methyltransferase n=1 Tax=Neochlamydia sp. AcF95 TaxID=2795734 RepID=UPI001BC8CD0F|nr:50S ribosomal protein L11 methyltransferase [Neochlamydia sp. AcF95]MBS4169847.1 Uncharacterized protein [Neochlamydia sp. AcF95]